MARQMGSRALERLPVNASASAEKAGQITTVATPTKLNTPIFKILNKFRKSY
jgi:hypothetical protein